MPEQGTEQEYSGRKNLRSKLTDGGAAVTGGESESARARQWRDATRELVLDGATARAAVDRNASHGSVSITLTGNALSNDLLLADTGYIAVTSLGDHASSPIRPMSVIPIRLDVLSDLPAIRVLGRGLTELIYLRLIVQLTARNPRTDATSVMMCEFDSIILDAPAPLVVLNFQLRQGDPRQKRP